LQSFVAGENTILLELGGFDVVREVKFPEQSFP
jgi:hypothetical protein